MRSMAIIVMLKIEQLRLQIGRRPESAVVQNRVLSRYSRRTVPDQPLYEGMRKRHVRNSLDFGDSEYPTIGLPLVESIQWMMVQAEVFWQTLLANRSAEHPAQRHSINRRGRQTQ